MKLPLALSLHLSYQHDFQLL